MNNLPEYNSQRNHVVLSEYGRNVQKLVEYLTSIEDREERNRKAHTVIAIMGNLNPHLRDVNDYKHKLWDHLFAMSDFKLDVDSPYPRPTPEILTKKPKRIPYLGNHIKFRFYGRNVHTMLKNAAEMEDGEVKTHFVNMIASFMKNSSKNWNDENLVPEAITDHIGTLTDGKLQLKPEDLVLSENTVKSISNYNFRQNNNQQRRNQGNNKNFKNNRNQQHNRNNNNNRRGK